MTKNYYRRGGAVSRNGYGKNMSRLGFHDGGYVHKHTKSEHVSDAEHANLAEGITAMISFVANYDDYNWATKKVRQPLLDGLAEVGAYLSENPSPENTEASLKGLVDHEMFWLVPKKLKTDLFNTIGTTFSTTYPNVKIPDFVMGEIPKGELKDRLIATTPEASAKDVLEKEQTPWSNVADKTLSLFFGDVHAAEKYEPNNQEKDTPNLYAMGVKGAGIATSGLMAAGVRERNADIKMVEKFLKANKGGHLTEAQWAQTKGSKLPNELFERASGQKGSILKWLTSRTSPKHFGPVETAMKYGAKALTRASMLGFIASELDYSRGWKNLYMPVSDYTKQYGDRGSLLSSQATLGQTRDEREKRREVHEARAAEIAAAQAKAQAEAKAKAEAEAAAAKAAEEARKKAEEEANQPPPPATPPSGPPIGGGPHDDEPIITRPPPSGPPPGGPHKDEPIITRPPPSRPPPSRPPPRGPHGPPNIGWGGPPRRGPHG